MLAYNLLGVQIFPDLSLLHRAWPQGCFKVQQMKNDVVVNIVNQSAWADSDPSHCHVAACNCVHARLCMAWDLLLHLKGASSM